jgi:hypothetical protein
VQYAIIVGGFMGLLDQAVLDGVTIQRMIFHVVGPQDSDLQLMDEIDASGFENFFLERVRETNVGNRFQFIGAESGVRPALKSLFSDGSRFVKLTKELAEVFQNGHKGAPSSSRGAFIVAQLRGLPSPAFALIKFDDQKVLRYQQTTTGGRVKAKVSEIDNTFIEDRKAMQKSALIVLNDDGGELAVYDRANKRNITDYFKTFLGVKRLWDSNEATNRFVQALAASVLTNKDAMPDDVKRNWRRNLHLAAQARETVEPGSDFDVFCAQVFGAFWTNEDFRADVERSMHSQRISGEVIELDRSQIRLPQMRRIKTSENITVLYPKQLDEAGSSVVKVEPQRDGGAIITIRTQGILDDDLTDESVDRRNQAARGRAADRVVRPIPAKD